MLFLLRSTVCIGLVASALPDHAITASLSAGSAAEAPLVDACRADLGRCRSILGAALSAEPALPVEARKLRDQPATGSPRLSRSVEVL